MLGCFGQRKKKGGKESSKSPVDRQSGKEAAASQPPVPKEQETPKAVKKVEPEPQPQTCVQPPAAPPADADDLPDTNGEVNEVVTVVRAQSLHQQAPPSVQQRPQQQQVTIKKAATLGRYDFLKKYDRDSYTDRWNALKQQYLAQKKEAEEAAAATAAPDAAGNGTVVSATDNAVAPAETSQATPEPVEVPAPTLVTPPPPPLSPQPLFPIDPQPPPKVPFGPGIVRSLPRQFSPSATGVSPVKFSQWFHERKTREDEARKECQDREERMQKIIEGPTQRQIEEAAVKIQSSFRGFKARREFKVEKAHCEQLREEAAAKEAAAAEAAAAEAAAKEAAAAEAAAAEAAAAEAAVAEAAAAEAAAAEAAAKEAATVEAAAKEAAAAEVAAKEAAAAEAAAAEAATAEAATAEAATAEAATAEAATAEAATAEADAQADRPESPEADETEVSAVAEAAQDSESQSGKPRPTVDDERSVEAAVKIQAGFRGMHARREVAEMRKQQQQHTETVAGTDGGEGDAAAPADE